MGIFGCFFGHQFKHKDEIETVVVGKHIEYVAEPGTKDCLAIVTAKEFEVSRIHSWCSRCNKLAPVNGIKFSRLIRYTAAVVTHDLWKSNKNPAHYFIPNTLVPIAILPKEASRHFDLTETDPQMPLNIPRPIRRPTTPKPIPTQNKK